ERRYGSVHELRLDLERHLAGFPVSARPDTWSYRLGKLLRRHALAATATAVGGLVVAAVTVGFTLRLTAERDLTRAAATAADQQRGRAERQRAETEEVVEFLEGLFRTSDPYTEGSRAADPEALALLDRGAATLGEAFRERPRLRARLLHSLGRIYSRLERFDTAEPLLLEALALLEASPEEPRLEIAELEVDLGAHYTAARQPERAEAALRRALDLRQEVLGETDARVAEPAVLLANVLHRQGRYAEGEELLARAVAIYEALDLPDGQQHALTLLRLGQSQLERGDVALACATFGHAVEVAEAREGAEGLTVAAALKSIGRCTVETGDLEAALPLFRRALAIFEKRLGEDSTQASDVRQNLAYTLYAQGQVEPAFELFGRALESARTRLGAQSVDVLALRYNLAAMRFEQGDPGTAEPELRRLGDEMREHLGPNHKLTLLADLTLGQVLSDLGRLDEAETRIRSSLERLEATFGPRGQYVGLALASLAEVHRRQGEPGRAVPLLERVVELSRATQSPDSPEIAEAVARLEEARQEAAAASSGRRQRQSR
ncbi:MAG: tetratricopeptide repeat protein, partial [Acidobacteria bacterium]|nr:tetratricopeptide repeat protein [Acidobacteriota bacterium]